MQKHLTLAVAAIGIAGSIVTISAAAIDRRWLAALGVLTVVLVLAVGYYKIRNTAIDDICRGLLILEARLKEQGHHSCVFVAFDRTGSAFASMLACHCGEQQVLTLNRYKETAFDDEGKQRLIVGEGVTIDSKIFDQHPLVVVCFHISTGNTLEAGLRYLKQQNCQPKAIVTLYITPGAKARWPQVIDVIVHPSNAETLARLPWVKGPYKHV